MSEWKPIETAPKTDAATMIAKAFIAYCPDEHPNDRVRIIWWEPRLRGGRWYDDRDLKDTIIQPSHWMPLPEPPPTGS